MKFNVKKKLNLSRIDKELWPYEDEVYEAIEADSLDEAQREVDRYYAEREGYFRARSEAFKAEANKQASLPLPTPATVPVNPVAPNPVPVAPGATPVNATPAPVDSGVNSLPPKEFN